MNPLNSAALAPLRVQLERLSSHWQGSPAQRLWRLWLSELYGMLPSSLRARLGNDLQIHQIDWPLPAPSELHRGPAERYILLLPANTVMVQRLTLPLIATRNLHNVLGFEMDKHTPFNAAQLYFDARVLSRSKTSAQVLLVAILRERLQPILEQCQQQGLPLQSVDVRGPQGTPLAIDLLPAAAKPKSRPANRFNRYAAMACAVLLFSCMALWLNARQALLEDMHGAVAEQRQQVDQLQRLRSELLNTRGAARYLAQRKAAQPTLSAVLADLTDCLGADTWLEELEISENGEVTLTGQSAKASDLITRVKNCQSLVGAQFQGIIQPNAETGKDHFSLRAHLRVEAADAPSPKQS